MTKYLDENGLAYFWTKIKAWLSSHAPVKYFGQNWIEDTNNDYALVVGNGVDENNPENGSVIDNNGVFVKILNDVDNNVAPASSNFFDIVEAVDSSGDKRMFLQLKDIATGQQGVSFGAQRLINGVNEYNGIEFGIFPNGERNIYFGTNPNNKKAWQLALNHWYGDFIIDPEDFDFKQANNGVSANKWPGFYTYDKNDYIGARFENVIQTDGKVGFCVYGKNYNASGAALGQVGIRGLVDKSGNGEYYIWFADKFRNALGAGSGIWPFSLGGTGMSGSNFNETISNVITPASGITITAVVAIRWGKAVSLRVQWKKNSSISVGANGDTGDFNVGTMKSPYRPGAWILGHGGYEDASDGKYTLDSVGVLKCCAFGARGQAYTIAANSERVAYFTFLNG